MAPLIVDKLPEVRAFCRRAKVASLRVFGNAARSEVRDSGEIDLVIDYLPGRRPDLIDFAGHKLELEDVLGQPVHLTTPGGLRSVQAADVETVTLFTAEGSLVG